MILRKMNEHHIRFTKIFSFFKNCLSFSRYLFSRIYLGGNLSTNQFKTWHRALWRIQGLGLYFSSVIYSNTSKCSQSSYVKSSFWFYLCYGLCFKKNFCDLQTGFHSFFKNNVNENCLLPVQVSFASIVILLFHSLKKQKRKKTS